MVSVVESICLKSSTKLSLNSDQSFGAGAPFKMNVMNRAVVLCLLETVMLLPYKLSTARRL